MRELIIHWLQLKMARQRVCSYGRQIGWKGLIDSIPLSLVLGFCWFGHPLPLWGNERCVRLEVQSSAYQAELELLGSIEVAVSSMVAVNSCHGSSCANELSIYHKLFSCLNGQSR